MEKSSARLVFAAVMVALVGWVNLTSAASSSTKDCVGVESSLVCFGEKMLRNVMKQVGKEKSLHVLPGVEIAQIVRSDEERERAFNEIDGTDEGLLGRLSRYLVDHELKINLGALVDNSKLQDAMRSTILDVGDVEEARKKDKGLGMVMVMGVMMGKMLGALGLGGVAMLALKALAVSMMALLLSSILGLKKLSEGGHHHKGRENDEEFHVTAGESLRTDYGTSYENEAIRRRRSPGELSGNLAYRGWTGIVQ
ncbi:uncharacterized protein LOC129763322 [Toxorhynchites rutilus septentrionalis]|uniref:uncharacterized protein LOC129763322 n=1 Tax=Toxorhynchites rutilus septentrionalis TaxID=329112 RepID=UPI002478DAB7|nr:uncharacterized protein LOC129763322 [Toxorhynchites rutilus septentrionalis]